MTAVLCGACFCSSEPGPTCMHCGSPLTLRANPVALRVGTVLDGKVVVGNLLCSPGGLVTA